MPYLSQILHPPKICLLTGGMAPVLTPPREVYDRLWDRVKECNLWYYEVYPGVVGLVKRIVRALSDRPVPLPSGRTLTACRFIQVCFQIGSTLG